VGVGEMIPWCPLTVRAADVEAKGGNQGGRGTQGVGAGGEVSLSSLSTVATGRMGDGGVNAPPQVATHLTY